MPIDEAAPVLGRSVGQLRRLCPDLERRGLASRTVSVVGDRPRWHIAAAYDERLIRRCVEPRTPAGESVVLATLREAAPHKRASAEVKARIVQQFRRWRSAESVVIARDLPVFLARAGAEHGVPVTRSRLYDWDSRCGSTADFAGCVHALLDRRGRPKDGTVSCSDAAWRWFCAAWLTRNRPGMRQCWEATRERALAEGWAWPSYGTVTRLVRERIDPAARVLRREGADAWRRKHQAPIEQDPAAWETGQCWEADHCTLDFEVRVLRRGGWVATRPVLTAWFDRRSRCVTGYHIGETGNAWSIRLALLHALRSDQWSVPEVVWLDNGKDFASAAITGTTKSQRRAARGPAASAGDGDDHDARAATTGLLAMLGIETHFALPYNHNGKARLERWFGLVHERFDKQFGGYVGSRPGMVERRDRRDRFGDFASLPTLEEVRDRIGEFIAWSNARRDHAIEDLVDRHSGEVLSPIEHYQRTLPRRRVLPDPGALRLLERVFSTPRTVHKWGISVRMSGGTVRYGETASGGVHPALEPMVGSGRKVFVSYDPSDTGRVSVWDDHLRFVAEVYENRRYGGIAADTVTVADRKQAWAERKAQRRRVADRIDVAALTLDDAELASRAARQRQVAETRARLAEHAGLDPSDVPPLRLVQTPLDGQAETQHRDAMLLAACGEHDATRRPSHAGTPADPLRLADDFACDPSPASTIASPGLGEYCPVDSVCSVDDAGLGEYDPDTDENDDDDPREAGDDDWSEHHEDDDEWDPRFAAGFDDDGVQSVIEQLMEGDAP